MILVTGVDWRRTVEAAERWCGTIVVATAISDTWNLLALDRKSNADGVPVANNPQPRHDFDPLGPALWKSR